MTDKVGKAILGEDGKSINTREYYYTKQDGTKVVIQDHYVGHGQFRGEAAKPHSMSDLKKIQEQVNSLIPKIIIGLINNYVVAKY